MYFDTTYFAKCVNNYLAFDHNKYLEIKIREEKRMIKIFVMNLLSATCKVFHDINGDIGIKEEYEKKIYNSLIPLQKPQKAAKPAG